MSANDVKEACISRGEVIPTFVTNDDVEYLKDLLCQEHIVKQPISRTYSIYFDAKVWNIKYEYHQLIFSESVRKKTVASL